MSGHAGRRGGKPNERAAKAPAAQDQSHPRVPWSSATTYAPDVDLVIRDTRRRVALIFRLNVGLSIAAVTVIVTLLVTAAVLGVTGHELPATVCGVAGLIPASVYRPLTQINRAFVLVKRVDWFMLAARERLWEAEHAKPRDARAAVLAKAWEDILTDLQSLTEDYSSVEGPLASSIVSFLGRH